MFLHEIGHKLYSISKVSISVDDVGMVSSHLPKFDVLKNSLSPTHPTELQIITNNIV